MAGFAASSLIPTNAVSTTALDKITDFGTGGADTITVGSGITFAGTVLRNGATLGANNAGDVALVRGNYDAAGTFPLFVYDSNGTGTTGTDYRGVVLFGYVDTAGNDTVSTAGVFTAVA